MKPGPVRPSGLLGQDDEHSMRGRWRRRALGPPPGPALEMAGVEVEARSGPPYTTVIGVVDLHTETAHDVGVAGGGPYQAPQRGFGNHYAPMREMAGVDVFGRQYATQWRPGPALIGNVQRTGDATHACGCAGGRPKLFRCERQVQFGTVNAREMADVDACGIDAPPDVGEGSRSGRGTQLQGHFTQRGRGSGSFRDRGVRVLSPWAALDEVARIDSVTRNVLLQYPPLTATWTQTEPPHQIRPVTRFGDCRRQPLFAVAPERCDALCAPMGPPASTVRSCTRTEKRAQARTVAPEKREAAHTGRPV